MEAKQRRKIDLSADPGVAGPPPGLYASEEEYDKDIAAGFPKMKEFIAKQRAAREAKQQAS